MEKINSNINLDLNATTNTNKWKCNYKRKYK